MTARRALRAAVPLVLLLTACSRDDGDDPRAATSTTTSVDDHAASTTTAEPTSPTTAAACPPVDPLPDATVDPADADGDGAADEVRIARDVAGLAVQVGLAAGGGSQVAIATFGVEGAWFVGATDLDGDGSDEIWVRTGAGASASILGLVDLTGCLLVQATFASGGTAEVPVGGTVGTAAGLACEPVALDDAPDADTDVTAFMATRTGDGAYDVTATEYAVEGATLRELRQSTATVPADSADLPRYGSFACDDLSL